jgi:hypothetical protein
METHECRCGNPADKKLSLEPEIGFFYFCSQECKDKLVSEMEADKEIFENNEYRQGKSRESYESSIKVLTVTGIILAIVVIFALISYAITIITKQLI